MLNAFKIINDLLRSCFWAYLILTRFNSLQSPHWHLYTATDVKSVVIWSLKWNLLPNLVLFLNTICNLQQLRMFFTDLFNLVLVCKDIEPRYGKTRATVFFSAVRVVSFNTRMLFMFYYMHIMSCESRFNPNLDNIRFSECKNSKIENYRPASILSCFSKVYERCLEQFKQIVEFFLLDFVVA